MAFLTPDQKKSLGPFLGIFQFALAAAGGVAVYTLAGGAPIPVISPLSALILGVVAGLIFFKQIGK